MYINKKVLAVIPARGGSKGIPRKNIRNVAGKPLIYWSFISAQKVNEIDALVVSTDNEEIASVADKYNVEVVPRAKEFGTDEASTEDALLYTIESLEKAGRYFDVVLVLEPTSPMRSAETIRRAIKLCVDSSSPSIVPVYATIENIGVLKDGVFSPIVPNSPRRRQLREPFYIESSTVYACEIPYLKKNKTLVCSDWPALIIPADEAIDINIEKDLEIADYLLSYKKFNPI